MATRVLQVSIEDAVVYIYHQYFSFRCIFYIHVIRMVLKMWIFVITIYSKSFRTSMCMSKL